MYKESGLKSEVVDRKRLYKLNDDGASHPMFQTVNEASNFVKQLHDHSNRDSCSDAVDASDTDSKDSGISGSDVKDNTSWISWFCNLRGNELFCQIDDYYIQDHFNLCGFIHQVPYYDYALDMILDVDFTHRERFAEKQYELVESAAEMLYGMIHARYILTNQGLASNDKYKNYDFGRCPRVNCCGQPCLPIGQSDIPLASTIKIYCPKCEDVYFPRSKYQANIDGAYFGTKCEDVYFPRSKYQANIDGAYFGTTFPHLFLMTYEDLKPPKAAQSFVPKVFGFKLHKP